MRTRVKLPGKRATDPRYSVTFYDEATPFPITFHFLLLGDRENPDWREARNIGCEFGEQPALNPDQIPEELTTLAMRRVIERYPHWVALARHQIGLEKEREGDLTSGLKRGKPARLDNDWYRMIAAEYRHHVDQGDPAPVTAIAKSHQVTPSAASRWVKAARERRMIEEASNAS